MSRYYGGWAPYVPVADRRKNAERLVAKLRKGGQALAPVNIAGTKIATSFWGRAWCDNLESYRDYDYRLERGRSYVRNGCVIDLQIAAGQISAMVNGSELYRIGVTIKPAPAPRWRAICADCAGGIDSLMELLAGKFSKNVMARLCRQESGLFPSPAEIRFTCSCPDHASMCKHVAAVLYGVGARLDAQPELLFRLRGVDETELIAGIDGALPLAAGNGARVLETDDTSALFGIDMAVAEEAPPVTAKVKPEAKRAGAKTLAAAAAVAESKPVTAKKAAGASVGKAAGTARARVKAASGSGKVKVSSK
jgi:uncharacterized Zn finger protein